MAIKEYTFKCPDCKKEHNINDIVEPIKRIAITELSEKILEELYPMEINKGLKK